MARTGRALLARRRPRGREVTSAAIASSMSLDLGFVSVDREKMILGSIAFGITYVLIAVRRLRFIKIDRASGAIIGAVLAVAIGSTTAEEASAAIDKSTILLLLAVMGMGSFL